MCLILFNLYIVQWAGDFEVAIVLLVLSVVCSRLVV